MAAPIRVRVSDTIFFEYQTRGVFGGGEGYPVDVRALVEDAPRGVIEIDRATAEQMLADAEYNGDGKHGPSEMPLRYGNAYRALAKQLRAVLGGK